MQWIKKKQWMDRKTNEKILASIKEKTNFSEYDNIKT